MRLILIPMMVALALQALPAQRTCYKCKGEGYIACKKKDHDTRRTCGKWAFEHKCSPLFSAACCRGTQKVFCERCNDPIAEAEITEELEGRVGWVKKQRELLAKAGLKGVTVETKNFTLHFMVHRWNSKEARLTRNRAAHLFAYRLQQAADRFQEVCCGRRGRGVHSCSRLGWLRAPPRRSPPPAGRPPRDRPRPPPDWSPV